MATVPKSMGLGTRNRFVMAGSVSVSAVLLNVRVGRVSAGLVVSVSVPCRKPVGGCEGLKLIRMKQEVPCTTVKGGGLVALQFPELMLKSPAFVPPTEMLVIVTAELVLLVRVTFSLELVCPTPTA